MSSANPPMRSGPPGDDLTARARIRDVAIHLFGQHGFRATTIRQIAEHAGVSPALVVHHFGSKQGLRDAIDRALAEKIRAGELQLVTGSMPLDRDTYRALVAEYEGVLPYLARALTEGDELGHRLFDRMFTDAVDYLQAGVDAGMLRPTEHAKPRAAALLALSFGVLLMQDHLRRVLGADDEIGAMLDITPAMLELYTHGLFADDSVLEAWNSQDDHAARIADPDPPDASKDA